MLSPEGKEKLKSVGMNALEEQAKLSLEHLKALAKVLVEDTVNPFDNMGYDALLSFEHKLLEAIDKIDGEEG